MVAEPAPVAPVAPFAPLAPPAPDRPVVTTAEVEPAAAKQPRAKTRAPKAAGGQAAQAPAGPPADVQTTLTGVTSSLPTSGLVEEVERQANDLVGQVTAPVTETLKPVADVKAPKIDLP
jgi:hypothetical protein